MTHRNQVNCFHFLRAIALLLALVLVACDRNNYEVVERTQTEAPNYGASGTHTEVHYVLRHNGRKIHATCASEIDRLDPTAACTFRPLRTYKCVLGEDKDAKVLSDLHCKDSNGNNVYLYVDKEE